MESNQNRVETCARAAHEVNQVFCAAIGDPPSPSWDGLSDAQRNGVLAGAAHALAGGSPKESHELWFESRLAEGWTFAEVKSFEKKTSPCMVSYDDLPLSQRAKDELFQSVVRAVAQALASK